MNSTEARSIMTQGAVYRDVTRPFTYHFSGWVEGSIKANEDPNSSASPLKSWDDVEKVADVVIHGPHENSATGAILVADRRVTPIDCLRGTFDDGTPLPSAVEVHPVEPDA